MINKITVKLPAFEYPIYIGLNILNKIGNQLNKKRVLIISNPQVYTLYGKKLTNALSDCKIEKFLIPDGEKYKTIDTVNSIYDYLIEKKFDRGSYIIAMGGGVIGDISGYVASTYMRGIKYVHVPTTLLAQVDSSIGGKVGVNHPRAKNVIGSFYQPQFVYSDIKTLGTLQDDEFTNGMSEVIKYALIIDKIFFEFLMRHDKKSIRKEETLLGVVTRCAQIKANIVEKDEKERDLRRILNFGHTIGHALESASGYMLKHGTAVSIGMVVAIDISIKKGIFREDDKIRALNMLEKYGLPTTIKRFDAREIIEIMKHDKKISNNKIQFILLNSIGNTVICDDIPMKLIEESLNSVFI